MGTLFDFNGPLFRTYIGYDDIFKDIERTMCCKQESTYPPFNIWTVKPTDQNDVAQTTYVELAVAGFKKCEIDITFEEGILTVKGSKQSNPCPDALYRGIAQRDFIRKFRVGSKHVVSGATLEDGILSIRVDLPMGKKNESRIEIK
jgi:molecular chaperone IbpA